MVKSFVPRISFFLQILDSFTNVKISWNDKREKRELNIKERKQDRLK